MAKKRERERERAPQHAQPFLTEETHVSKKKLRPLKQHPKEEKLIPSSMMSKILKEALLQQKEIEDGETTNQDNSFSLITVNPNEVSDDSDDDDLDDFGGTQNQLNRGYDEEVNKEEEKILETFMSNAGPLHTMLDLIIKKIREKDEQVSSVVRPLPKLDSATIDLYKGVGTLLSKYTSGKLPKAFKQLPLWELWEDLLYQTEPEKWSANAIFQATRIFASNLKAEKAQRFYSLVLLPRIREDIRKNKTLHFDIYRALKKSLYKPSAFFKGILFPLCESGTCRKREADIIGSVIQKFSIPPDYSGAAILKLAEMDHCGTTSYFIKLLLDKKYALPYLVLDGIVAHFLRFLEDTRVMPVIWHQSLLTFVQRYKNELTKEDKENLEKLLQYQKHYMVTDEIRRELKNSHNRGEKDDRMLITSPAAVINKAIEEDRFDLPDVPMEED